MNRTLKENLEGELEISGHLAGSCLIKVVASWVQMRSTHNSFFQIVVNSGSCDATVIDFKQGSPPREDKVHTFLASTLAAHVEQNDDLADITVGSVKQAVKLFLQQNQDKFQ